MKKICGDCKKWERIKGTHEGICCCPIPAWVLSYVDFSKFSIVKKRKNADRCQFFEHS